MKSRLVGISIFTFIGLLSCQNDEVGEVVHRDQEERKVVDSELKETTDRKIELLPKIEELPLDENVSQLFNDIKLALIDKNMRQKQKAALSYAKGNYSNMDNFWSHDEGGTEVIKLHFFSKDSTKKADVLFSYNYTEGLTEETGGHLMAISAFFNECSVQLKKDLVYNFNAFFQEQTNVKGKKMGGGLIYRVSDDEVIELIDQDPNAAGSIDINWVLDAKGLMHNN